MAHRLKVGLSLAVALLLLGGAATGGERDDRGAGAQRDDRGARSEVRQAEPHPGPNGYRRVTEPEGSRARPGAVDRGTYEHNYQAPRTFKIGPYHPPRGWTARRWTYGQILPRAYWAPPYLIDDYWLFGLEVPPIRYEWVRDGADAILVNTATGEILQVEYGVFA